jgi:hypothetical protein
MKLAGALCAVVIAVAARADASCFADNSTHVELESHSVLRTGSGLIAQYGPIGAMNPLANGGGKSSSPSAWKIVTGTDTIEFTTTHVAPGLVVVVPSKALTGEVDVTDPQGKVHKLTFKSDALPDVLPAPKVRAIKRRMVKGTQRGEKSRAVAYATFRGDDPPSGAHAIIAFVGNKAVAWGTARSGEEQGYRIFHGAIPCLADPNEEPAPRAGTKIQLAWLDQYGRLSKRSAPIAIK